VVIVAPPVITLILSVPSASRVVYVRLHFPSYKMVIVCQPIGALGIAKVAWSGLVVGHIAL